MNDITKQTVSGATVTAGQVESRSGFPEPQIEVRMPKGTHFRKLHAALHLLAAEAELATPAGERWIVQTSAITDERGRVYLELCDATAEEAKRGLEFLKRICG